jgi:hypothetical protein
MLSNGVVPLKAAISVLLASAMVLATPLSTCACAPAKKVTRQACASDCCHKDGCCAKQGKETAPVKTPLASNAPGFEFSLNLPSASPVVYPRHGAAHLFVSARNLPGHAAPSRAFLCTFLI